ncbi:MAG: hypothetical protein L6435_01435 [Anaerolineae bacterium]|nr:hypothetical protein [Anaerolineae bacterium]
MIGKIRKVLLTLALVFCLFPTSAGIAIAGDQNYYGNEIPESSANPSVLPYLSDGDIWLVDTDGISPRRITHSGRAWAPSISPDGTRLAFWALPDVVSSALQNHPELWIINLEIHSPSSRPGVGWNPAPPVYGGAAPQQHLVATGPGPVSPPSWSPDGRQLAWIAGDHLVVSDLSGETRTLTTIEVQGIARPEVVWSPDGRHLICSQVRDGARGLWSIETASGTQRLLATLSPDGPVAYAFSPEVTLAFHTGLTRDRGQSRDMGQTPWSAPTAAHTALGDASSPESVPPDHRSATLHLLRDFNQTEETVIVPDAVGLPEIVTQLAWSSDSSQLALVGSDGGVYVARTDTWVCRRLPGIAAFIDRVRWIEDGSIACWGRDETAPDQMLFVVSPISEEVTRLSPPTTPLAIPDLGQIPAGSRCAAVPYDWYRYQGAWDSGAMAHSNCGPACVAMAIQYARNNLWVPISTIRDYIGGSSWTYPSHLQSALDYWGVPNQRLYSMQDIHDAVASRGSIVLVHLWMYWFTPGSDYLSSYSDPLQHYGRYYSFDQSHWVILSGFSQDGSWAICHDPNVWDSNGLYWYAGGIPKGKDRHYQYTQLVNSIADYGYQAIEVYAAVNPTDTPTLAPTSTATPTPTATPTSTAAPTATHTPPLPTPTTPDPYPTPATPTPTTVPSGNAYINGSVVLQGRPSPPHSRWIVALDVTLLQGGSSVATVLTLTDDFGNFCIGPFGSGTYDVRVKNFNTLSNLKQNVLLVPGGNPVFMGELRVGDASNDNVVDIDDFAILKEHFATTGAAADFNQDGIVDIDDFGWLKENFGQAGDIIQSFAPSWSVDSSIGQDFD